jgi:hypothetical protein
MSHSIINLIRALQKNSHWLATILTTTVFSVVLMAFGVLWATTTETVLSVLSLIVNAVIALTAISGVSSWREGKVRDYNYKHWTLVYKVNQNLQSEFDRCLIILKDMDKSLGLGVQVFTFHRNSISELVDNAALRKRLFGELKLFLKLPEELEKLHDDISRELLQIAITYNELHSISMNYEESKKSMDFEDVLDSKSTKRYLKLVSKRISVTKKIQNLVGETTNALAMSAPELSE